MTSARPAPPSCIFLLILLGLLAMFAASFQAVMEATLARTPERSSTQASVDAVSPAPMGMAGLPDGGPELALTEQQADELTELMRKLQADPNDGQTLIKLGDVFLMARDWARAEAFLNRAMLSRPADIRPRYMLGICQYQQGKIEEARRTYEELLSISEDPPALYNLALIYKYHLNNKDKAEELLRKVISSPEADLDTLERAKKEL